MAYLLYAPLYVAGPITCFNAWISQIYVPQNTHTRKDKLTYFFRLVGAYICLEIWMRTQFSKALCTLESNSGLFSSFSFIEICLVSFGLLVMIWLKFLVLWRTARCFALFDDVESPENMNRCIFNNYCFEGFWRSWHRGFNQWLIRYIFVPLGGRNHKFLIVWVVFTWVALWHDMNLNLLFWAWGICLAMMPEILLKSYFNKPSFNWLRAKWWWKYVQGLAGGLGIIFLVITNLIGFGVGYKVMDAILFKLADNVQGIIALLMSYGLCTFASVWMFSVREKEEMEGQAKGF